MPLNDYVYWIDSNLPPKAAIWLHEAFGVNAIHVMSMNMLSAPDPEIFKKAAQSSEKVILLSKDEDIVNLVLRKKPPPYVIWITTGNLSNIDLKSILLTNLEEAVEYIQNANSPFVEIN
jgi:predicted nuclease of predicted toxin-antitoxin system